MDKISLENFIKMLLLGADQVIKNRDLINSINVFPVPDSDTGSNLEATFKGVKKVLTNSSHKKMSDLSKDVLDAAFNCSQGNSGLMMTSFLAGFLASLVGSEISDKDLAKAFERGAVAIKNSVENPKNGTILDVTDTFAKEFKKDSSEKALAAARSALIKTENKMKVLSDNHVVDAGALGFTLFLYGFFGEKFDYSKIDIKKIKAQKLNFEFPYEVIFIVSNSNFEISDIKNMFHPMGDSLDIVQASEKIKIHIHTNEPDLVAQTAQLLGKIESIKTVDMRKEETHE